MKKCTILAALGLSMILVLSGCSKDSDKKQTPEKDETNTASDYDVSEYITLGQYKGIEYEPQSIEVTDSEVQERIQLELENNAKVEEVKKGKVAKGDTVNIKFVGKIDGKEFEGGSSENYDLTIGSNNFIEGFEEGLVGVKVGDTVELDLKFPDPYQNNPDYSGKPVVFTVTVNYIKKETLPEYNLDFVKSVTSHKTLEEYEKDLIAQIKEEKETEAEETKLNDVMTKVIENSTFNSLPESEVEKYTEQRREYWSQIGQYIYGMELKDFITAMEMTEEEFEEKLKEEAEQLTKQVLVFKAIIKKENLTLTDEEYQKGLEEYTTGSSIETTEEFEETYGKEMVEESLLFDKAMDFIVDSAVAKAAS